MQPDASALLTSQNRAVTAISGGFLCEKHLIAILPLSERFYPLRNTSDHLFVPYRGCKQEPAKILWRQKFNWPRQQ
ncbi:hypothetical protein MKleb_5550 (plasmid) [Klebsiella sp. PL-2018]|nr:hypothetical protein MKleb_5394 [Klebsiella sp. PL-2018]QXD01051.1 hypothetical protein MKleb_5550 [Klebsiella sp. PL-2018]